MPWRAPCGVETTGCGSQKCFCSFWYVDSRIQLFACFYVPGQLESIIRKFGLFTVVESTLFQLDWGARVHQNFLLKLPQICPFKI